MASIIGRKPPVIAQVYESWTSQFLDAGAVVPVSDFIKDSLVGLDSSEIKDIFPIFIYDNTFEGKLVSMPFNKSVPAYYYNEDLLKELGYEKFPTTWDSLRMLFQVATKDTNNDGYPDIWGTAYSVNMWLYECMLYQNGGRIFSEDGKNALLEARQALMLSDIGRISLNVIKWHI